jgi:hypothetical protein
MAASTAADTAVKSLAGQVIARTAPAEEAFFPEVADRFLAVRRTGRHTDDELLGYGVGEAVALLTPVVLLIASTVVQRLAERAGDAIVDRGSAAGRRWWRRVLRRPAPGEQPSVERDARPAVEPDAAAPDAAAPDAAAPDAAAPGARPAVEPATMLAVRREQVPELRRLVRDAATAAGLGADRAGEVVEAFIDSLQVIDD